MKIHSLLLTQRINIQFMASGDQYLIGMPAILRIVMHCIACSQSCDI